MLLKRTRQFPTAISTTQFVKLYILHLLTEKDFYGQEMIDSIHSRLGNRWKPSPGMVYPLLRELEENLYVYSWWIEPEKRSIKKYRLTKEGYAHYQKVRLLYEDSFRDAEAIISCTMKDIYKA